LLAAVPQEGSLEWWRVLPEQGLGGDLICGACSALPGAQRRLVSCCEGCLAVIEQDVDYFRGFLGTPKIRERPQPLASEIEVIALPATLQGALDVQPNEAGPGSAWVFLTGGGELFAFNLEDGELTPLLFAPEAVAPEPVPEPAFPPEQRDHSEWRAWEAATRAPRALALSRDGRFAAIVAVHGSTGTVIDIPRAARTMRLDRGDHHVWACRFSCAFLEHDGRTLLAHPTAWNRLDVSDPTAGELLTARDAPDQGSARDLDYFHGALSVSPSGDWVADDGWVWHPVGVVRSWSAKRWVSRNPWESEDGPSLRKLCWRNYYWDKPTCWVGDTTLAVTGIGTDDDHMLPGVRIFDVASGTEQLAFAGPDGELFYDKHLFSSNPEGLQAWDPRTGERLAQLPGFTPTRHHHSAKELIEIRPDHILRWRIPQ
jgi:hypothetical protein